VKNANAIASLAPDAPPTPTITPIFDGPASPTPAAADAPSGNSSTGDSTRSPRQGAATPPDVTEIPSATTPSTETAAMDPSPPPATKRAVVEATTPCKRRKSSPSFSTEPSQFSSPVAPPTAKRRLSCVADEDKRPLLVSTLKRLKRVHRTGSESPVIAGKKRGLDEGGDGDAAMYYRSDVGLKRPRNGYFQPGDPPMEYETWSDDEEEEVVGVAEEKHGNREEGEEVQE
jgi:hypothetical protein